VLDVVCVDCSERVISWAVRATSSSDEEGVQLEGGAEDACEGSSKDLAWGQHRHLENQSRKGGLLVAVLLCMTLVWVQLHRRW